MAVSRPLRIILLVVIAAILTGEPIRALDFVPLPGAALLTDPAFARPGFADLALPYVEKTRYLVALDVDFETGHVLGHAQILFVNSGDESLHNVVFRLYPNHPWYTVDRFGNFTPRLILHKILIDGEPAYWNIPDVWDTVLDLSLVKTLNPGDTATFDVEYEINYPAPKDNLALLEPYPLLAVHDETGWREDVATQGFDYVYSESALHAVKIRVASDVSVWSTGVTKSTDYSGELATHEVVTGPVREFVAMLARGWKEIHNKNGPVPINVHYAGRLVNAVYINETAAASMNYYDTHFGPYPYAELDIIAMPFSSGGEEYPALIFCNIIGDPAYVRFITAHEMAHQWFYGVAGNDIIQHAWLDESLAQISGYLFYRSKYGNFRANREYWPHITNWLNRQEGPPKVLDTDLGTYDGFADYMATIYGRGAQFMRELSNLIGENQFVAGLWEYYHTVYLGIGTPDKFFDAIQSQTDVDLQPRFCEIAGVICPDMPTPEPIELELEPS